MLAGMTDPIGVLVMAYGTADGPEDIPLYGRLLAAVVREHVSDRA